jgi:hypothetical protein
VTGGSDRLDFLIRAYPKAYRERRGEEILDTLRDDARTMGTYESLRVGIDITAQGLRMRLGIAPDQFMGQALVAAALPGMMMAAAVAIVMPIFGHVLPDYRNGPGSWGPATAIWPGLCIVWILGSLAAVVFPSWRRLVAAVCVAATLIVKFLLPLAPWGLPSGFLLLGCLAIPSLLAARTPPRWSHRGFAVLAGVLVLVALVGAAVHGEWYSAGTPGSYGDVVRCAPYVAGALIFYSGMLLVARRWVTGSAIALLTAPWLLIPAASTGLLAEPPTSISPLAVAAACAIGIGLLGAWASDLWKSHRTLP